jgi:hypothetical protein
MSIPCLYWNTAHDKEPTKTIGAIAIHTKRLDSKASPLSLGAQLSPNKAVVRSISDFFGQQT